MRFPASRQTSKALGKVALTTVMLAFLLPLTPVQSLALTTGALAVGATGGCLVSIALATAPERSETIARTLVFGGLVVGFGALFFLPTAASYVFLHGALAFLWARALGELAAVWLSGDAY
jgi:hypothetical protein